MERKIAPRNQKGFTILEVMLTLFILTCTVTAVLQLMATGDRINGRRLGLSFATMLAGNQVETIRDQVKSVTLLGDTSYEASINGIGFDVRRVRVSPSEPIRPDTVINFLEFAVEVKRKNTDVALVRLRLLQGLHEK
jgi:prepilin-type N-terminal cleavage/methylation domain-containing protein